MLLGEVVGDEFPRRVAVGADLETDIAVLVGEAPEERDEHLIDLGLANDPVKTRAIRQQRMQQNQRRTVAGLRGIEGAAGETPIHSV